MLSITITVGDVSELNIAFLIVQAEKALQRKKNGRDCVTLLFFFMNFISSSFNRVQDIFQGVHRAVYELCIVVNIDQNHTFFLWKFKVSVY